MVAPFGCLYTYKSKFVTRNFIRIYVNIDVYVYVSVNIKIMNVQIQTNLCIDPLVHQYVSMHGYISFIHKQKH